MADSSGSGQSLFQSQPLKEEFYGLEYRRFQLMVVPRSTASLCRRTATRMEWGFTFTAGFSPDQKWSVPLYSACRLNDQTLRELAEAPAQRPADDPYAWDHRANTYLTEVKRFLFNVLLFPGVAPRRIRTRPGIAGRPRKEGPLEAGVAGRPLPGQGGLSAGIPSDRTDLDPTVQDGRPRRLT
jgi:hypothetical protein